MKKTIFLLAAMICMIACAPKSTPLSETVRPIDSTYLTVFDRPVYADSLLHFYQVDEHTWAGHGSLMYNEAIYLLEGENAALLIDAGLDIPNLREVVESLTDKPVFLAVTHVHPDHTGKPIHQFDSILFNAADEVNAPFYMTDYQGKRCYMYDGQVLDLGGRRIELVFTPGHTPGSTTFLDLDNHYGFSGDAFGSNNLLVTTSLMTVSYSSQRLIRYMQKYDIPFCFPGHYWDNNLERIQRIADVGTLCEETLAGKREWQELPAGGWQKYYVQDFGVRVCFNAENVR